MALMAMTIAFVGCKSDEPSNGSQDGGDYQLDSIICYEADGITKRVRAVYTFDYGNDNLVITEYSDEWRDNKWERGSMEVTTCTGKIPKMTQGCYNFLSYNPTMLKATIGWSKVSSIYQENYYDGDWRKYHTFETTYTVDVNGLLTEEVSKYGDREGVIYEEKETFTSNSQGQPISSEYFFYANFEKRWSKSEYTYNKDGKLILEMKSKWDYEKEEWGEFQKAVEISYNGNEMELVNFDYEEEKYTILYDGHGNISNFKWYSRSPQHEGEWKLGSINQYYYSKVK